MKYYCYVLSLGFIFAFFSSSAQTREVVYEEHSIANEVTEDHQRVPQTQIFFKTSDSFQYSNNHLSNDSIGIWIQEREASISFKKLKATLTKEQIEYANQRALEVPNSSTIVEHHKVKAGLFNGVLNIYQSNSDSSYSCDFLISDSVHAFAMIFSRFEDFKTANEIKAILFSFAFDKTTDVSMDYAHFTFDSKPLNLQITSTGSRSKFVFKSYTTGKKEGVYFISILESLVYESAAFDDMEKVTSYWFEEEDGALERKITDEGELSINGLNGYFIASKYKTDLVEQFHYSVAVRDENYLFYIHGVSLISDQAANDKLLEAIYSFKSKS